MIRGLCISALISTLLGIIGGLFYFEMNELKEEQAMLEQLRLEVADLRKTNSRLILELMQVQAINGAYDVDARFIESEEGYEGLAGIR